MLKVENPVCQCGLPNKTLKFTVLTSNNAVYDTSEEATSDIPNQYVSLLPCKCPKLVAVDRPCNCSSQKKIILECQVDSEVNCLD